jgi:hypothetical protein
MNDLNKELDAKIKELDIDGINFNTTACGNMNLNLN